MIYNYYILNITNIVYHIIFWYSFLDLSGVGEDCYYNGLSGSRRDCKPGLQCDVERYSEGYSGTCIQGEYSYNVNICYIVKPLYIKY